MNDVKIDFKRAVLAAIIGTLAVDVSGVLLTGTFWDIPALLADKLGAPLALGVVLHYGIGFTLAVIYGAVAPSLPGDRWTRALLFVTVETVLGVYLFMFPLLGAGFAGLELGIAVPVISLIRHAAFGVALGALYPVSSTPSPRVATT